MGRAAVVLRGGVGVGKVSVPRAEPAPPPRRPTRWQRPGLPFSFWVSRRPSPPSGRGLFFDPDSPLHFRSAVLGAAGRRPAPSGRPFGFISC